MKKMLTHTPRKKNERNSQRGQKTQNSKFSLVVILRRKNESAKNFAVKCLLQKPKKEEKKNSLVTLFLKFPFLASLFIIIALFSFFLSFSAATKPEFFLLFARKNRKREIERD